MLFAVQVGKCLQVIASACRLKRLRSSRHGVGRVHVGKSIWFKKRLRSCSNMENPGWWNRGTHVEPMLVKLRLPFRTCMPNSCKQRPLHAIYMHNASKRTYKIHVKSILVIILTQEYRTLEADLSTVLHHFSDQAWSRSQNPIKNIFVTLKDWIQNRQHMWNNGEQMGRKIDSQLLNIFSNILAEWVTPGGQRCVFWDFMRWEY